MERSLLLPKPNGQSILNVWHNVQTLRQRPSARPGSARRKTQRPAERHGFRNRPLDALVSCRRRAEDPKPAVSHALNQDTALRGRALDNMASPRNKAEAPRPGEAEAWAMRPRRLLNAGGSWTACRSPPCATAATM